MRVPQLSTVDFVLVLLITLSVMQSDEGAAAEQNATHMDSEKVGAL
jgi:hypothetical protein